MAGILDLLQETGFTALHWRMLVMWVVAGVLLYLAVRHKFEPLLLVPIAFGSLLANLPTQGLVNRPAEVVESPCRGQLVYLLAGQGDAIELERTSTYKANRIEASMSAQAVERLVTSPGLLFVVRDESAPPLDEAETIFKVSLHGRVLTLLPGDRLGWAQGNGTVTEIYMREGSQLYAGENVLDMHGEREGGLFYWIGKGIDWELFPPLIFLGVGALTDFGPLIANPRTLLLGAAAQFGVFATFLGALAIGFSQKAAAAIGIIGGADGPTSIFLANKLAPELLAPIAVSAYSYMALVPLIQPPIMRALTSKKERQIRMKSLRQVSKLEKLLFASIVTVACILVVPEASALIGMLMFGNFLRECGVVERLLKAAQNELINIITIFLGLSVGVTMTGDRFLRPETLGILVLGVLAFGIATASGVLMAKLMNLFSANKINPLIGSAGVSAVPMAARVSQVEGQKADPGNFLLMHAMGPNVAGVIGTAMAAGYFIKVLAS